MSTRKTQRRDSKIEIGVFLIEHAMNYSSDIYKEQFQTLHNEYRRLVMYLVYKDPRLLDEYAQLFTQRTNDCVPKRISCKRTFVTSIRLMRSFFKVF
jgi:hypothetical protein